MNNPEDNIAQYDDEIDLLELFNVLWAAKTKIIMITAVFAIASVGYALSLPNQYKATVLLAPAQEESDGLAGALGQLGGLASLAGVNIGAGGGGESKHAQEIMKSRFFIERYIADNNLAVEVFAAKGWSKSTNELIIDDEIYDLESQKWLLEDEETGALVPPTGWQLYESFFERLSVSEDVKSGLVTVSIEYYSPQTAKKWLDSYIKSINRHMQARRVAKVSNNIEYLQAEIEKTPIAEMQEVFYTLVAEQTKSKMLAQASPDYAFAVVHPSMVPEEKSQPQRALICVLGTLLGGMLSVLWALVMHYTKKSA